MASNYTTNYKLPLWERGDNFVREEFNEAHEKVDAAIANEKCRVLLREETIAALGAYSFDVDVTGLLQSDYWAIEIYPEVAGGGPISICMNGDKTSGNYKTYDANHNYINAYTFGTADPLPGKNCITLFPGTTAVCGCVERADTMWQKDRYYMPASSGVTPETLNFIRFQIYQGPYTSDAKIKICGVRR